jgi:hypothetical protein
MPQKKLVFLFTWQSCWMIKSLATAMEYSVPSTRRFFSEVFPDVHDFICHFHFFRDIGKDYLEPAYTRLHKCLRSHGTSTRLHALARELRPLLVVQNNLTTAFTKAILHTERMESSNSISPASTYSLVLWALQGKHCGD